MIFATDLGAPEGPALLPDGSWLCVEMAADRGWVAQIGPDGREKRVVARTGRPNGLAVDRDGAIWVAESQVPSLLRLSLDGACEVFLTGCDGEPFLFPNDLALGPDGLLYLTDSGVVHADLAPGGRIRDDYEAIPYDGRVYRIDTKSGRITKLDSQIKFTNGIAVDAAGSVYVNETMTGNVYRYERRGGDLGPRALFGNVNDPSGKPGWRGPDGMKFAANGDLYVTVYNQGDVTVLDRYGRVAHRIPLAGRQPTNLAFGPNGTIFVTEVEHGRMEMHAVGVAGLALFG